MSMISEFGSFSSDVGKMVAGVGGSMVGAATVALLNSKPVRQIPTHLFNCSKALENRGVSVALQVASLVTAGAIGFGCLRSKSENHSNALQQFAPKDGDQEVIVRKDPPELNTVYSVPDLCDDD